MLLKETALRVFGKLPCRKVQPTSDFRRPSVHRTLQKRSPYRTTVPSAPSSKGRMGSKSNQKTFEGRVFEFLLCVSCLGKATISNDGATILKLLDVVHPAAKTLVDIAKSQDAEVRKRSRVFKWRWKHMPACSFTLLSLNVFYFNLKF